jgi:hypothetical protein
MSTVEWVLYGLFLIGLVVISHWMYGEDDD